MLLQVLHVCVTCNKPQEFIYDGLQMKFLGCKKRESLAEVETHLVSEHALRAGAGAVRLHCSGLTDAT